MADILKTVLLFALPASGKSEVRKYLEGLTPEQCREEFHLGHTLQLDDYPYVHFMHRIDDELYARGLDYVFYKGPNRPFRDGFEWGTLIELLNEDYHDLMASVVVNPPSAAQWLFDRLDAAREKVGLEPELGMIPYRIRMEIAESLEDEVKEELARRNTQNRLPKEGKTVVIEAARGGANGAAFPLTPPQGYEYSIGQLSDEILEHASVLYVWVLPAESRRKNYERGLPDGQHSILFHSVPAEVMLGEYGCDDMEYLLGVSDRPNTIKIQRPVVVEKDGQRVYDLRTWHLPVARFDNRADLTSFVRKPRDQWESAEKNALHEGLKGALATLASLSK